MLFELGRVVMRRYVRGSHCTFLKPMRVVRDDEADVNLETPATRHEDGAFPFDGTHVDFRPDPAWSPLKLPAGAYEPA